MWRWKSIEGSIGGQCLCGHRDVVLRSVRTLRNIYECTGAGGAVCVGLGADHDSLSSKVREGHVGHAGIPGSAAVIRILHVGGGVQPLRLQIDGQGGGIGPGRDKHTLTINTVIGMEYSVDNGASWNAATVNMDIAPYAGMTMLVRRSVTETILRSSGESELSGYHVRRDLRGLIADGDCNGDSAVVQIRSLGKAPVITVDNVREIADTTAEMECKFAIGGRGLDQDGLPAQAGQAQGLGLGPLAIDVILPIRRLRWSIPPMVARPGLQLPMIWMFPA